MKRTTENTTLKTNKGMKAFRLAALAASCSVAAIIGIAVMQSNEPAVAGYAYNHENKVAAVASGKKVSKSEIETPEKPVETTIESQPSQEETPASEQNPVQTAPAQVEEQPAPTQAPAPEAAPEQTPAPVQTPAPEQPAVSNPAPAAVEENFTAFEEVEPVSTPAPAAAPVEPAPAPVEMTPAPVTVEEPAAQPVEVVEPVQNNSLIGDDGIWHISYVPAWGAGSAPEDGSIGIWADGWFIAHSGMINGDTIASLPQYVEVDGQVYTMTDTWVSGDSVSTEEIARARANNGIVFQTCITDTTNRLVHYEPVNRSGYAYNFTSFPYTANDAVVFGF